MGRGGEEEGTYRLTRVIALRALRGMPLRASCRLHHPLSTRRLRREWADLASSSSLAPSSTEFLGKS